MYSGGNIESMCRSGNSEKYLNGIALIVSTGEVNFTILKVAGGEDT